MKNLKLAKKLFISYALILIMLILGYIVSVADLIGLGKQIETFYDGPFTVNGSANIINSNFERMQKAVYRSISNSDPDIVNEAIANAKEAAAVIQEQIPVIQEHFLGDQQIIARLDAVLTKLAPMREEVLALAAENKNAEAADYMEKNNVLVIKEAQEELDSLIESGNTKGEALVTGLRDGQANAVITLVILGSIGVIVSIIFGVYITRGITRPVGELDKAARSMAQGELSNVRILYNSKDEMGSLAENMRRMAATFAGVIQDETYLLAEMAKGNFNVHSKQETYYVGEFKQLLLSMRGITNSLSRALFRINNSADEVAANSEQMSSGAQILARGATEQAASLEELSGMVNEISEQVDGNAKDAREAREKSLRVKEDTQKSSRCMDDMLSAMMKISESSLEISKIIKLIGDIASKTNILALNAAVEASRAGSRGKSFSVIADEVRVLANRSASELKSTAALVEISMQTVENGRKTAQETADVLSEVVRGVDSVAASLDHITEASVKQSGAVRQITENIESISDVVQANSAAAQESAAASEELSSQALMLKQLVEEFQLRDTDRVS